MTKARRVLIATAGSAAALLVGGFLAFSATVARLAPAPSARADGIVVLTGGEHRIAEAVRLLSDGRAARLLISGVNRRASREQVRALAGLSDGLFECCVEIGYEAHDTISNADETRSFARRHGFRRLIVVTSSYHVPRAMAEIARALPDVELVAFPVRPRSLQLDEWWARPAVARLLVSEYLKFLPAAARCGASMLVRPFEADAAAPRPHARPTSAEAEVPRE